MRLLIPLVLVAATACSPVFKLSTRQGNVIDEKKLEQVEVGMNREQVEYLLGSPLLADDFQPNRWDYVSYYRSGAGTEISRTVSLYFDGDILMRLEDSKPTPTPAPEKTAEEAAEPAEEA
ncbi:MAG: outer membrane protein assembly factor BamE [Oceanococcus sp.]